MQKTETNLDELEAKSIYIIREAYRRFGNKLAALVSWGKDSVTMLYLVRKAFFGKVPIFVMHIDTSYKFKEIYEFRDEIIKKWDLKLLIAKNYDALKKGISPKTTSRFNCCTLLKTEALKKAIKKFGLKALLLAIRRDEHAIRAKERTFSLRTQDFKWNLLNQLPELWDQFNETDEEGTHVRVHPMLHWTERQIWQYIKRENIPVIPLYFSGYKKPHHRYRSIGCEPCCVSIPSDARTIDEIIAELETTRIAERSGRSQDKEKAYMMQKLRVLGYM